MFISAVKSFQLQIVVDEREKTQMSIEPNDLSSFTASRTIVFTVWPAYDVGHRCPIIINVIAFKKLLE